MRTGRAHLHEATVKDSAIQQERAIDSDSAIRDERAIEGDGSITSERATEHESNKPDERLLLVMPGLMRKQLFELLDKEAPNEGVVLLASKPKSKPWLESMSPVRNVHPDREHHYLVLPHDQWRLVTFWNKEGRELRAVAHSHVDSDAEPSETDFEGQRQAAGVAMIIVSLRDREMTAWQDGQRMEIRYVHR